MPPAELFSRLGLFCARGFLDEDSCARLRSEISAASTVPGAVAAEAGDHRIDAESRRTAVAEVSAEAAALVGERLEVVVPEIERHFSIQVEGRESLQFLAYGEGDFFEPHRDHNPGAGGAEAPRPWRVSVVVFLSREADEPAPGTHGGGALTFYGLLGGEGEDVGLPLSAEEGLLVAFSSELAHGVTPVTHGQRHTVVTWFF